MSNEHIIPHPHIQPALAARLLEQSERFAPFMDQMVDIGPAAFAEIDIVDPAGSITPGWRQAYFSWLDALSLCAVLRHRNPSTYLEIGSGNSTRFARWCIDRYGLRTRIVSIDPQPRLEVDQLSDVVIRQPVEDAPRDEFDQLSDGDVCFYDGSHLLTMGGDMAYVCYRIFPGLPRGVMLGLHDTYLPVLGWNAEDYYAGALLLGGDAYAADLPAHHLASVDRRSRARLMALLATPRGQAIEANHFEMFEIHQGYMDGNVHGATFFFSKAAI